MSKRKFWHFAILSLNGLFLAIGNRAAYGEGPSQLLEVLKNRAGATQTFQADVVVTTRDGRQKAQHGLARQQYVDWLKAHGRPVPPGLEKQVKVYLEPAPVMTTYYRYYARADGVLRVDSYGLQRAGVGPYEKLVFNLVYTGDRWEMFKPTKPQGKGGVKWQNDMAIHAGDSRESPAFEIARAAAVEFLPVSPHGSELSSRCKGISQVPWKELLKVLDMSTATDRRLPLPEGGPPKPVLEVYDKPRKGDTNRYFLRMWFDDERGHLPLRMECYLFVKDASNPEGHYLMDQAIDWSDPQQLANGSWVARKAVERGHTWYSPPVEGVEPKLWPQKSYELTETTFSFSKVRVNEPLDDSIFKITPPPGTNVTDEVSHVTYIVGSSGEELRKMALQSRAEVPPRSELGLWGWLALYAGLPLLAVSIIAVAVYVYRRRQPKRIG